MQVLHYEHRKEVNVMKRLSEVCKEVGVTRRALQGYNEIGLLKPTSTTEAGYWLYDDDAIKKLKLIQIFVERAVTVFIFSLNRENTICRIEYDSFL